MLTITGASNAEAYRRRTPCSKCGARSLVIVPADETPGAAEISCLLCCTLVADVAPNHSVAPTLTYGPQKGGRPVGRRTSHP